MNSQYVASGNSIDGKVDYDEKYKEDLKKIQKEVELLKEDAKSLTGKMDSQKFDLINTLAIFIGLFTFSSVEFQMFKSELDLLGALGFTLLFLGGLGFFLVMINVLVLREDIQKYLAVLIFVLVMIGGSVCFISASNLNAKKRVTIESEQQSKFNEQARGSDKILVCLKHKGYFSQKCFE